MTRWCGHAGKSVKTSRSQAHGSMSCSAQLAIKETITAVATPPPSLPTNSQFFRPTAIRRLNAVFVPVCQPRPPEAQSRRPRRLRCKRPEKTFRSEGGAFEGPTHEFATHVALWRVAHGEPGKRPLRSLKRALGELRGLAPLSTKRAGDDSPAADGQLRRWSRAEH